MSRSRRLALALSVVALPFLLLAPPVAAGTQDFTLVNETGTEVYALYLSETSNENWEEDVLGEDVLPDGDRVAIGFEGRSACLWDILVEDEEGGTIEWNAINLCETSVVVLRCDGEECWAEYE